MGKAVSGVGAAAVTAATLVVKKARDHAGTKREDAARWRCVTVNVTPEQLRSSGQWPQPLADWGEQLELRTRPAPGGRGTELSARLRDPDDVRPPQGLDGETPVQQLRSALRRAKQLVETGEVLQADAPGTTEPTMLNAPLRAAVGQSGGQGRL